MVQHSAAEDWIGADDPVVPFNILIGLVIGILTVYITIIIVLPKLMEYFHFFIKFAICYFILHIIMRFAAHHVTEISDFKFEAYKVVQHLVIDRLFHMFGDNVTNTIDDKTK